MTDFFITNHHISTNQSSPQPGDSSSINSYQLPMGCISCLMTDVKFEVCFLTYQRNLISKNIFACLFSIHNTKSLSRHEQVCLSGLRFERYFSHHRAT